METTLDTIRPPRNLDYGARQNWLNIIADSGYWFTRDTMRFFNSRILWQTLTETKNGYVFVSSESNPHWGIPRKYTVREYIANNGIATVANFHDYTTRAAALAALRAYISAAE